MSVEILFEDEDIIVCIKPRGILSQDSDSGEETMVSLLKVSRPYIAAVHRLDRAVGGIMVYAKSPEAAAELSGQIQNHIMHKEYLAAVHGTFSEKQQILQDILFKDSAKNKSYVVKTLRKGAKKASLEYCVIAETEDVSLLRIRLHTGRTHQIRVQFASRKHPLLGDGKYGGRDSIKNIALYSVQLSFRHPRTGEFLNFSSEPNWAEKPWNFFEITE